MKHALLAAVFGMMVICGIGRIQAQDEDQIVNIAYLYGWVDQDYIEDFFDVIRTNLQEHSYILELQEQYKPDENLSMFVQFDAEYDTEHIIIGTYVELSIIPNPMLAISPVLAGGFQHLSIATSAETAAKLATAVLFYSMERCDLARPYFEDWLAQEPDIPILYTNYYRANCELVEHDYEAAIPLYEAALFDSSGDIYTISAVNLAWAYVQIEDEEKAFGILDQLIENHVNRSPHQLATDYVARAQLYALAFRFDDAIADMDAAIELDPDNPELYVQRGQIVLLLYEWDRVLADYNHAIELDPDYADTYYYRGVLFYTQAYREEALPDFERYLELAPDGDHAADAAQYITDIQRELSALTEP